MESVFVRAFVDELEKIAGKWVSAKTKLKYGVPALGLLGAGTAAYGLGKGIEKGKLEALLENQR